MLSFPFAKYGISNNNYFNKPNFPPSRVDGVRTSLNNG